jgi:general secretion pathway protein D
MIAKVETIDEELAMKRFFKILSGLFVTVSLMLALPLPLLGESAKDRKAEEGDGKISFNFKDASVDQVLIYLSRAGNLTFIKEVEVEGKVTALSATKITVKEALEFLSSWLLPQKKAIYRVGSIVKIISLEEAKRRGIEVRIGMDPDAIEESERIITQILPLRYIEAERIKSEFAPLVGKDGSILSNSVSNSIVLTDSSVNVKRFAKILKALDQQVATVMKVKVYQLKNADPEELAKTIQEIFRDRGAAGTSRQRGQRQPFWMQFIRRGRRGQQQQQSSREMAAFQQEVRVNADTRTNSIVVSGTDEQIAIVDGLVQDLDSIPADEETTFVYHLKHADAENVAQVLTNLLGQATSTTGRTTGRTTGQRQRQSRQARQLQRMLGMSGTSGTAQKGLGLVGNVTIVSDKDSNSLLCTTSPRNIPKLKLLIGELDMARAQVLIEVVIAQVALTDQSDLGIEWSWEDILHMEDRRGTYKIASDFGLTNLANGLSYTMTADKLTGLLKALAQDGRLNVLSTPKILTLDNEEATISVGRRVPFVRNSRITQDGDVLNTIQYEDVGIILKVTPHINQLGFVRMTVSPEVSQVAPKAESVPISPGVEAAVFEENKANTSVVVKDGYTVIIGGLMRESETVSVSKIPFLGDIPLLRYLFSYEQKKIEKSELVVFLTPRVVFDAQDLEEASRDESARLKLLPNLMKKIKVGGQPGSRRSGENNPEGDSAEAGKGKDESAKAEPKKGEPKKTEKAGPKEAKEADPSEAGEREPKKAEPEKPAKIRRAG